jgi:hypothetical protein
MLAIPAPTCEQPCKIDLGQGALFTLMLMHHMPALLFLSAEILTAGMVSLTLMSSVIMSSVTVKMLETKGSSAAMAETQQQQQQQQQ